MSIERALADRLAAEVYRRFWQALEDAAAGSLNKLAALAYSETRQEKWFVMETYARVWRDWRDILQTIGADDYRSQWEPCMELNSPNNRKRFDMAFGPAVKRNKPTVKRSGAWFATTDTPVFQVKIVRTYKFDEAKKDFQKDVDLLVNEGMRHGYLFVLFILHPPENPREQGKLKWRDDDHLIREIEEAERKLLTRQARPLPVEQLRWDESPPIATDDGLAQDRCGDGGAVLWSSCQYRFFTRAFRAIAGRPATPAE